MSVRVDNPAGLGAPMGLYSHVAQADAGRLVFVAGQTGLDDRGALVGDGDVGAQTRQTFRNVGIALESAGAAWADVAKMTTYLISEGDIEPFFAAREAVFSELFPDRDYPPNTLIVTRRLVRPELLVEVEAIAVVG
jgi:enamine deaminase RidA (YjgF/YER057c/UK114 family)